MTFFRLNDSKIAGHSMAQHTSAANFGSVPGFWGGGSSTAQVLRLHPQAWEPQVHVRPCSSALVLGGDPYIW
jgi:hypothetical protein